MKEVGFNFVVAHNDGGVITEKETDDLMDAFIEIVEKRGMSLGGGYGRVEEGE
jgi:uncharacterized protein YggL (DUF469 family)